MVNILQQLFLITKQVQKKNINTNDYLFYAITITASKAGLLKPFMWYEHLG
jgi:hypothetical protein